MPAVGATPFFGGITSFQEAYDIQAKKIVPYIEKQLKKKGVTIEMAVSKAMKKFDTSRWFENAVLNSIYIGFQAVPGIDDIQRKKLARWFLAHTWSNDTKSLSSRIVKRNMGKVILNEVKDAYIENRAWTSIAKRLTDTKLIKGDVAGHIWDLIKQGRKALKDPAAAKEYEQAVRRSQRQIKRLSSKDVPTTRLKKAYENVVRATEKGTKEAIDKAVGRAVNAKARYNAERIARTETAKAYGAGQYRRFKEDEDVIGVRWVLSTRHNVVDVCDVNAGANQYGMGAGVYPKDNYPAYPAHPHCLCHLSPVYEGEAKVGKFDPAGGERYLKRQSERRRKQIMGVEGNKIFKKNPDKWRDHTRMYNPKTVKDSPPSTYYDKEKS